MDERWVPLIPGASNKEKTSQPGSGVYSKLVLLDADSTPEESKVWSESSQVASETGIFNTSLLVAETDIEAIRTN